MRSLILISAGVIGLLGSGCAQEVLPQPTGCEPAGYNDVALLELRENKFVVEDDEARQALALAFVDCLSDTNPDIRDGVGYEGLATWMRGKELNAETLRTLKQTLLEIVRSEGGNNGFDRPFAALVLSEIARVDRVTPFMSDYDRTAFVGEAAAYMQSIKDYRGYNDRSGWRHNVAHGADWLMQLSLNDQITKDDFGKIRDAVSSQIRADNKHAYIHGEPARLARPILFLARRGAFTEAEWTAWIEDLAAPAPLDSWQAAFRSESGLAQRHNLKLFLSAIYLNATMLENEGTANLLPGTKAALMTLP